MLFSHFVMIEREVNGITRRYVTHSREPRFSIEVDPSYDPVGKIGGGFIKGIRLNNSWTGDYHRCLALVKEAEEFFRQSFLRRNQRQ